MANTAKTSGVPDKKSTNASGRESAIITQVSIRAYQLYESRGKKHGHDLDDWLRAERQVLSMNRF